MARDWLVTRGAREWALLGVVCPACRGSFEDAPGNALRCTSCRRVFDQPCGIPDLRLGDDPYLTREDDLTAARALAARGAELDFAALYASYYASNDKVSSAQAAQFTRGVLAAGGRAAAALAAWRGADSSGDAERFIDLGCGTAPLAIAATASHGSVIGIDVGLRWLVLAARRAADAGLRVPLVCANAEHLPLADGVAGTVAGESVIENVRDHRATLAECHRVLRAGGELWLSTASRWSLGPDPHVGVLAGGWWPESWLRRRVARLGAVFPRRHLFSPRALRRALTAAGFASLRLSAPPVDRRQLEGLPSWLRGAVLLYGMLARVPLAAQALRWIGPGFSVRARRV
jgi:SAM-dependent methyltransferase